MGQNNPHTEPWASDYLKMWSDSTTEVHLNEVKGENCRKDSWIGSRQKGNDKKEALPCHFFPPYILGVHVLNKSGFYNNQWNRGQLWSPCCVASPVRFWNHWKVWLRGRCYLGSMKDNTGIGFIETNPVIRISSFINNY